MSQQPFELGQVMITRTADETLNREDVIACLKRHAKGDWGDLDKQDRMENQFSLEQGFRLLSAYRDRNRIKFWIITEADRSVTTVLLPGDY